MKIFRGFSLLVLLLSFAALQAQYDPYKIFVSDFYSHKGDNLRTASGSPGPDYWQNTADYQIEAALDVNTNLLTATVSIEYANNSSDQLDFLWLQADQNIVKASSKAQMMRQPGGFPDEDLGYQIEKIDVYKNNVRQNSTFYIYGTRIQVRLEEAVKPGEKVNLVIPYSFVHQEKGLGLRSGHMDIDGGKIFLTSYWYPRMSVYDDYYGWNTLPFIGGGEMYLDFGNVDYKLTLPSDMVVVGAGELVNAKEILQPHIIKRLEDAARSDKPVMIRKADELNKPVTKGNSKTTTWHFKMENTRDVAWAASDVYMWDAVRIKRTDGTSILGQSVYPKSSLENRRAWGRSTDMLKQAVEFYCDFIFDFPYPVATMAAGPIGGMEFPGFSFAHWDVEDYMMYLLVSHEIGHTWFPLIVGSDERRDDFLDEGFNTFMNIYAQEAFNNGELAPKRDGEYAPGGGNPADEIIAVIEETKNGPFLVTPPDAQDYKHVHPLSYFKTAFGLVLLREVILEPERFDFALRRYANDWAYKHPRPEDFFRSMDNSTGEDLTWFWQGWFRNNWQLDQAVTEVTYNEENPKNGAKIIITNKEQMVMPILIKVEETNGNILDFKVPVEIWRYGGDAVLNVKTTSKIKRIILDEKNQLPDIDRSNNEWKE